MPINKRCRHKSPQVGEAGFTLIEMIIVIVLASILGTFIFQVLTKSLSAQIAMQKRKERADDAVMVLEKISREVREAESIITASSNKLTFKKADTVGVVRFIRDTSSNRLRRQSAADKDSLPGSGSGNIVAENVTAFTATAEDELSSGVDYIAIDLEFEDGSDWKTKIHPRNY